MCRRTLFFVHVSLTFEYAVALNVILAAFEWEVIESESERMQVRVYLTCVCAVAVGAVIAAFRWKENVAPSESKDGPTIPEAWRVMTSDR